MKQQGLRTMRSRKGNFEVTWGKWFWCINQEGRPEIGWYMIVTDRRCYRSLDVENNTLTVARASNLQSEHSFLPAVWVCLCAENLPAFVTPALQYLSSRSSPHPPAETMCTGKRLPRSWPLGHAEGSLSSPNLQTTGSSCCHSVVAELNSQRWTWHTTYVKSFRTMKAHKHS